MPFTKGELGYFNSHVVVTPPIDEFFASHAALAFFLVSVIVEEAEAYAFSQAYVLSKKIALDYLRSKNQY